MLQCGQHNALLSLVPIDPGSAATHAGLPKGVRGGSRLKLDMLCHGDDLVRIHDGEENVSLVDWATAVESVGPNNNAVCSQYGRSERLIISNRLVVRNRLEADLPFDGYDHSDAEQDTCDDRSANPFLFASLLHHLTANVPFTGAYGAQRNPRPSARSLLAMLSDKCQPNSTAKLLLLLFGLY